jgi:hypothetical protein
LIIKFRVFKLNYKMSKIVKVNVNTAPTYWDAYSEIIKKTIRIEAPKGLTNEECEKFIEKQLKIKEQRFLEREEVKKIAETIKKNKFLSFYSCMRNEEINSLNERTTHRKNNSSWVLSGGYTPGAIDQVKREHEQINQEYEKNLKEIQEKYNNTTESYENFRERVKKELNYDHPLRSKYEAMKRTQHPITGPRISRLLPKSDSILLQADAYISLVGFLDAKL